MAQIFNGQIRFGIHAPPQHANYADYTELWKTAEELGYDWADVFDHFQPIQGDPENPCLEAFSLLAAMAAKTSRIRCAVLVASNTYRHPALLANIAATIDHISGGRLEVGIGAGWWQIEHEQYGIPFPPIGRRIRALAETAKILRLLWTQQRTTFAGRYYQIANALCEPKPVQEHLPLWIGGTGEQLTLRVVAESADGWNTFMIPIESYERKLEVLDEHCRAVGRDPREIRKSLAVQLLIGETEAESRERLERMARTGGLAPEVLRDRALVGTPEQAAGQLLRFVELGVGDFLIGARTPVDTTSLRLFIEKVAPLVRKEAARMAAGSVA